ncbi:Disease resistance protein RGA2 [Rhynchospora pubera]|uniref:Disease resistance protein RGA2 n=1 Tax=Rhynchospora pubera TaxID=906938 RepID=A0AAV8GES3_9POAL|nr:Disease resistance protein RGA2 [Rhynchospora pubera]
MLPAFGLEKVAFQVAFKLIIELIKYAKDQKEMQLGLKNELARLEKSLPQIEAVVTAVDQSLIREENQPLVEWLWQLRDASDLADDVMDEVQYNLVKEKVEPAGKASKMGIICRRMVYKDPYLTRLQKAVKALDEVAANVGDFYTLAQDLVKNKNEKAKLDIINRETSSTLNAETQVFGRKGWEKLLAPLSYGESGSMILLTTRMKSVADSHGSNLIEPIFLKGLNERDTWDLFERFAFGQEDPSYHKELSELGRHIVKKLGGSPLAIKTVGALLRSNLSDEFWRSILLSELWSIKDEQNNIMPALRLTYQYLPSHLKPCFSYCTIFPQDHCFDKEQLIYMWMAVGLVPRYVDGMRRPEDIGSDYFNDLVNKSIFNHDKFRGYVMHHLIHELSTFVSKGECFRCQSGNLEQIPNTVRHLNVHVTNPNTKLKFSTLSKVRTLILNVNLNNQDPGHELHCINEMLKEMKSLRCLSLSSSTLSEFPDSVGDLLFLRYFNLSCFIRKIPKSMSRLYLLQTMVYLGCEIEADMLGALINLRHLVVSQSVQTPVGIERLTSLQELNFIVGKVSGHNISELRNMKELRILSIKNLQNVGSPTEANQADLTNKVNLHDLTLEWYPKRSIEEANDDEKVLNNLKPPSGLKKLKVKYYMGKNPPLWLKPDSLSKLTTIEIYSCNWEHLPSMEELPLLKSLYFGQMSALRSISHECNQLSQVVAFPSLEELSFWFMPSIERWFLANQPSTWMDHLRKLSIEECPQLSHLPPLPATLRELSLKKLGIVVLPNFWKDQNGTACCLPSLSYIEIIDCSRLLSLTKGFFQQPEILMDLEELVIWRCKELKYLPPGGFSKLISLKLLSIAECPNIQGSIAEDHCFLPPALKNLNVRYSCGDLGITLPKALEYINSLNTLELCGCANFRCLPPKGLLIRWKTLRFLTLTECQDLTSIKSILGLCSIESLEIRGCPKLGAELDVLENRGIGKIKKWFSDCSMGVFVFFHIFLTLCSPISEQSIPDSTELPSMVISSHETTERQILTVSKLQIDDPLLLSIEPLRSLSTVRELTIGHSSKLTVLQGQWLLQNRNSLMVLKLHCLQFHLPLSIGVLSNLRSLQLWDAYELQSLPKLPPCLQELSIYDCNEEFSRRYHIKSGVDWPKISHIPKVVITVKIDF